MGSGTSGAMDGSTNMLAIWIGALLIIAGVTLAAVRTARRGRLSDLSPDPQHPTTLEPQGRGKRLSLKTDLPGIAMVAAGAFILLIYAAQQ